MAHMQSGKGVNMKRLVVRILFGLSAAFGFGAILAGAAQAGTQDAATMQTVLELARDAALSEPARKVGVTDAIDSVITEV